MYIKSVEISNVKAIEHFQMDFPEPAGWHVLIGDNGAGKTALLQTITLGLYGFEGLAGLWQRWDQWIRTGKNQFQVEIQILSHENSDEFYSEFMNTFKNGKVSWGYDRGAPNSSGLRFDFMTGPPTSKLSTSWQFNGKSGWFSSGFGPFRRLGSSESEMDKLFESNPRVAGHMSLFTDKAAYSQVKPWLTTTYIAQLEQKVEKGFLQNLYAFINQDDLLPGGTKIKGISSTGIHFQNIEGHEIEFDNLSDGFRSILSLTLELIRQMISIYKTELLFEELANGRIVVSKPGVVLIDEIDAHLHPTWQTRIGQWFTKYFPKIQFIVTTHSPLICRAAEKGTIWKLSAPGSEEDSGEITGIDKQRLMYGTILDAYSSGAFGSDVDISEHGLYLLEELSALKKKRREGLASEDDRNRIKELESILPTGEL
jgi:predicted ATP-binding protein involved in virulence